MRTKRLLSILLALVIVLCTVPATVFAADGDVTINEVNFPDATFRAYVKENFDKDNNDILSAAEIENATAIRVFNQNITSLKGIEHLASLNFLSCGANQLTSLDVSKNTALTFLECCSNQLTTLDVSKNTALEELNCHSNRLTTLDVSNNTALVRLYCELNQLTTLDVSKNTNLTELRCDSNQLATLDVSGATALTVLDCYMNQLTTLDVSKNTALEKLNCFTNRLTTLDVSKNTKLTELWCSGNQLTTLDVSKNTKLTQLYCDYNQLTSLDISRTNIATNTIHLSANANVYSITLGEDGTFDLATLPGSFDVTKVSNWYGGTVDGNILTVDETATEVTYDYDVGKGNSVTFKLTYANLFINERNFPDYWFRSYVKDFDVNNDGILSRAEIKNVKTINLNGYGSLKSLKGVEYFTALTELYCYDNQLTTLDVSKNTKLTELWCSDNQLTSINANGATALTVLMCYRNQLTSLNVNGATALTKLNCSDNQLASLDVSENTKLTSLDCDKNQLTTLYVSNNTELTELYCDKNQLTELNVSSATALTDLRCRHNQLTELDVSNNTELTMLFCEDNQLMRLDVSKNTKLYDLWCYDNQLTVLDVRGATALGRLLCWNNQLTSLDISHASPWIVEEGKGSSFSAYNNVYSITPGEGRTFDLTTLPGSFDVTKASNWNGGTVSGNILTVDAGATEVTYTYDVGYDASVAFKLVTADTPTLPHEHSYIEVKRADATCTDDGYVEYTCECGETKVETTASALGHVARLVNETAVYTGDIVCKRCGDVLEKGIHRPFFSYPIIPSQPPVPTEPPVPVEPTTEELPFTDVAKDAPYYDAVKYLYETGIMKGTGDTTFSPDFTLNRATVVTMLYRLEGEPEVVADATFTDVEADEWYTAAVYWAASVGIVNGYGDGTFGPKKNVTNEQLAAIIVRYAKYKGIETTEATTLPEGAVVSDWAVSNVAWAASTGVLDASQTQSATEYANRAQVAMSVYIYIIKVGE